MATARRRHASGRRTSPFVGRFGGPDRDYIIGGNGRDLIRAGAGNDDINAAAAGARSKVDCGKGLETVRVNNNELRSIRNCERILVTTRLERLRSYNRAYPRNKKYRREGRPLASGRPPPSAVMPLPRAARDAAPVDARRPRSA